MIDFIYAQTPEDFEKKLKEKIKNMEDKYEDHPYWHPSIKSVKFQATINLFTAIIIWS